MAKGSPLPLSPEIGSLWAGNASMKKTRSSELGARVTVDKLSLSQLSATHQLPGQRASPWGHVRECGGFPGAICVPPGYAGVRDHTPCLLPSPCHSLMLTSQHPQSRTVRRDLRDGEEAWTHHLFSGTTMQRGRERALSSHEKVGGRSLETQGETSNLHALVTKHLLPPSCILLAAQQQVGSQGVVSAGVWRQASGPVASSPDFCLVCTLRAESPVGGGPRQAGRQREQL